jgi:hypothetical protein
MIVIRNLLTKAIDLFIVIRFLKKLVGVSGYIWGFGFSVNFRAGPKSILISA